MNTLFNFVEKNPEFSTILIAISFSALGYLIKSNFDKKEKLKVALYNLLEVWNQVIIFRRLNAIDFGSVLESIMTQLFPGVDIDKEIPVELKTMLIANLAKMVESEDASKNISKLKSEFEDAIRGIASYDPILAYKTNNIDILGLLNGADECYNSIRASMSGTCTEDVIADISAMGKQYAFDEILTDLEGDIRSLAWEISPFAFLKVMKIIYTRSRSVSLDSNETQELADKAKLAITNLINKEAARIQAAQQT